MGGTDKVHEAGAPVEAAVPEGVEETHESAAFRKEEDAAVENETTWGTVLVTVAGCLLGHMCFIKKREEEELGWQQHNASVSLHTHEQVAMCLLISTVCQVGEKRRMPSKIFACEWRCAAVANGQTEWRSLNDGMIKWEEFFIMPVVKVPKHPAAHHHTLILDLRLLEKGITALSSTVHGQVKIELTYSSDKRRRATLPFISDDGNGCRYNLVIEVQMLPNATRPSSGDKLFPAIKGMPGKIAGGAAAVPISELPLKSIEPILQQATTYEHDVRKDRLRMGPQAMANKDDDGIITLKTCRRCKEEYSDEFNSEEACVKGKHLGHVEQDKRIVFRNIGLGALGGAMIGSMFGMVAGATFLKVVALKPAGITTAAQALRGASHAMYAGLGISKTSFASHLSAIKAKEAILHPVPTLPFVEVVKGYLMDPVAHPCVFFTEVGIAAGGGGAAQATFSTHALSANQWSCCGLHEDVTLCSKKTSHVPEEKEKQRDDDPHEDKNAG